MKTKKNNIDNEDFLSIILQNPIYDNMTQYKFIRSVIYSITTYVPSDLILAVVKYNASALHYAATQNIMEIIDILGHYSVGKLNTFKDVDKLLEVARREAIMIQKMFSKELILDLYNEFAPDLNIPIPKKNIQIRLQAIFNKYEILKPSGIPYVVTQNTITYYINMSKVVKRGKKNSYDFYSFKQDAFAIINPETDK